MPGAGSDGRVEIREAREKKVVWSKKDIEGDGSVVSCFHSGHEDEFS